MHNQAEELERLLRLQSSPVGLKLLRSIDEIPEGAQQPLKDMGHHLSLCQAIALARRDGITIAEAKEDMWCFEPVIGLGFEKPPQRFLDGHNRYPFNASTLEAGATWAQNFPRLDYGVYSEKLFKNSICHYKNSSNPCAFSNVARPCFPFI